MMIRKGGHPSGFTVLNQDKPKEEGEDDSNQRLFHIRGTTSLNTRAIQVDLAASSLNSGDSFVAQNDNAFFIWYGKGCNADEKKYANNFVNILQTGKPKITKVEEGREPNDFWSLLGGKGEYASASHLASQDSLPKPRLFLCSNASGVFTVERIDNYSQDDLSSDDVMLLDAFNEVYVWVGNGSNELEKKMAMETAVDYVKNANDGRSAETPVFRITEANEPTLFTAHFHAWESSKTAKKKVVGEDAKVVLVSDALNVYNKKYSFEELIRKPRPSHIDTSKLEEYLEDEEFIKVFGMTRAEFAKVPTWKRTQKKKSLGLF